VNSCCPNPSPGHDKDADIAVKAIELSQSLMNKWLTAYYAANRQGFSHREADEKSLLDEAFRREMGERGRANGDR